MSLNKNYFSLFTSILMIVSLLGCSQNHKYEMDQNMEMVRMDYEDSDDAYETIADEPTSQSIAFTPPEEQDVVAFATTKAASSENDGDKKFIRTAQLHFKVKDIVSATHAIEDIIIAKKGFVISSVITVQEQYSSHTKVSKDSILVKTSNVFTGNLSLRVHHSMLDESLRQIAGLAEKVTYRKVVANEITFTLMANKLMQERKLEKSKRLKNISGPNRGHKLEDLISAEEAIDQARESADNQKIAEIRQMDQVEYSLITIVLEQDPIISSSMKAVDQEVEGYRSGILWKVFYAIADGWNDLLAFIVGLLRVWPALLIISIAIFGALRLRKKWKKKE